MYTYVCFSIMRQSTEVLKIAEPLGAQELAADMQARQLLGTEPGPLVSSHFWDPLRWLGFVSMQSYLVPYRLRPQVNSWHVSDKTWAFCDETWRPYGANFGVLPMSSCSGSLFLCSN